MLFRFGIAVLLGHAEINDVNHIGSFRVWSTDQEVIGFNVSVDQVLFVDRLDARELHRTLGEQ